MADPIMWTDRNYAALIQRPASRWDAKTGKRVPVLTDDGERAVERLPQTGRVGTVREVSDIRNTQPMPLPRSIHVLRDDGHEVDMPIRSAAAAGNGDKGSDNSFARYVLAKATKKGWIVNYACPVDLVIRRERRVEQMKAPEVKAAIEKREACGMRGKDDPPCSHYFAELAARQARRHAEHERQGERQKSQADRTTDALVQFVEKMAPAAASPPAADQEFAPIKRGPGK